MDETTKKDTQTPTPEQMEILRMAGVIEEGNGEHPELEVTAENENGLVKEQDVFDSIQKFVQDDRWAKLFDEAPENAKIRLAISFYYSDRKDEPNFPVDAYRNLRQQVEAALTPEDLEYLVAADLGDKATARYKSLLDSKRGAVSPSSSPTP